MLPLNHGAVLRRESGRVRYQPADRLWLAALSQLIPRRRWTEVFAVTAATLLAWHRRLAARKCDHASRGRPGRHRGSGQEPRAPRCDGTIRSEGIAVCRANWSSPATRSPPPRCGRSCNAAGIDPAPGRTGPAWKQFLNAQARILAVDFLHVDTVLVRRIYALIVTEHAPAASISPASPRTRTAHGRHKQPVAS